MGKPTVKSDNGLGDYRITQMPSNPGLYYERGSSVEFARADWRVALFIDTRRISKDWGHENESLDTVYQNCLSLVVRTEYTSLLRIGYLRGRVTEVMHLHKEAEQLISEITTSPSNNVKSPKTIVRRSVPLGFIGSLSRSLFGTLNMEDAEYFDREIDKLYDYQSVITQIVKNQTHIVMSDLHQTHEIIEQLASRIDSNRLEINKLIETQGAFKTLNYSLALIQYSNSVEISLNHYINGIRTFMTAIVAARQGKLHPSLLGGPRLGTVLREISQNLRLNITELVPSLEEYTATHEVIRGHPELLPWKVDTDNSLREVEERLEIIGHQRREREHHLGLTYGSYLAQIAVVLFLILYLSCTYIYNIIRKFWNSFVKQKSPSEPIHERNEQPLESMQILRPPLPPQ